VKFSRPLIYLITGGHLTPDNFSVKLSRTLQIIESAVTSGIPLIQIREKNLPARLLFEVAAAAVNISRNSPTRILINDRADVALAAGADGVHLTAASISARITRKNVPAGFLIGVSTHTIEEAVRAERDGADFAVFGPVFATPSKERYGPPQGIEKLAEVVKAVGRFPVVALGGIEETNLSETLRTGASGIAAIRLLNEIEKMPRIVEKIKGYARGNEQ
jgi:thiamine-phosphate pyrophosphorylase